MQIKRFFASDTHKALRMVREAMGPDAVIIANHSVDGGVEIVASGDYDDSKIEILSKGSEEAVADVEAPRESNVNHDKVIDSMRDEIHQLKNMMESQLSAMKVGQWGQQDKVRAGLFKQFSKLGLGADLITRFVAAVGGEKDFRSASRKALALLARKLITTEKNIIQEGGIVVLVGPTGAGKTTTIAKLAAQFSMHHGTQDIVLVSADNRRIGAHEQLLAFGKLLGIPVLHARNQQELDMMLSTLTDKKLVLVDSSGMGQADLSNLDQILGMSRHHKDIEHYLVLPATMQRVAMDRILTATRKKKIAGCILTKVDEAAALGDAFTSLLRHKLPIAFWADGQRIQEDLYHANVVELVTRAVSLAKIRHENKDDRLMLAMLNNASQSTGLRH